jgi:hypothetical protein
MGMFYGHPFPLFLGFKGDPIQGPISAALNYRSACLSRASRFRVQTTDSGKHPACPDRGPTSKRRSTIPPPSATSRHPYCEQISFIFLAVYGSRYKSHAIWVVRALFDGRFTGGWKDNICDGPPLAFLVYPHLLTRLV